MATWLVAIVGGTLGSVATALVAWGARFFRARGEVEAHDRFVSERDGDLASWVSDRSLALWRELNAKSTEMAKISILKERPLHEYRDQERQA